MSRFSKYSGAGNDFVIVRAEEVGLADPGTLARRICPRSSGVGVDGLILERSLSEDHVRVRFFNPDGSEFGTCGNGSRCAARYAVDRGLVTEPRFRLVTDDGSVGAEVHSTDGSVSLDYRLEAAVEREVEVELDGVARRGWLVRIGTPHVVVLLSTLPDGPIDDLCRPVRRSAVLGPEGANVDLISREGADAAAIRTYERGVEGETQACGSGAMAAALALRAAGLAGDVLSLRTRSGETLRVELPPADGGGGSGERDAIRLTGPARHLFDGVFPDRPQR